MSSYEERYCYPNTGVLRNHLNIRDPQKLERAEAVFATASLRRGLREPFEFSPDGLRNVHRQMLEKLYPFAGEFRREDMAKIDDDGKTRVPFQLGAFVAPTLKQRVFDPLQHDLYSKDGFQNPSLDAFAHRASVYLKDLNFIHPFPEGNGRVQRVFLQELARHSGYELDHRAINRTSWMDASRESYSLPERTGEQYSRHSKMSALIAKACEGKDRLADRTAELRQRYEEYRSERSGSERDRDDGQER